jgi:hypothetical protein
MKTTANGDAEQLTSMPVEPMHQINLKEAFQKCAILKGIFENVPEPRKEQQIKIVPSQTRVVNRPTKTPCDILLFSDHRTWQFGIQSKECLAKLGGWSSQRSSKAESGRWRVPISKKGGDTFA